MIGQKKLPPEQQPAENKFRPVYPGGWALQGHLGYVSSTHQKRETGAVPNKKQQ